MTRILPQNTDTLNNPSHSFLHRVVSVDTSSPQSSIDVGATGNITIAGSIISTNIAALTTIAESWIGPSLTTGIYFKGGNVGIGTTSPGALLTVGPGGTGVTQSNYLRINGGSGAGSWFGISFNSNGTQKAQLYYDLTTDQLRMGTSGSDPALILTPAGSGILAGNLTVQGIGNSSIAGNVGIGTTGPDGKLIVNDGTNAVVSIGASAGMANSRFYRSSGITYLSDATTGGQIDLNVWDGTNLHGLRILNNGNVGIGTTGPTLAKLQVAGATLTQHLVEPNTVGVASPNIITLDESDTVYTNEGATALNYHTLPTAAVGLTFTFYVDDADGIRIVANTDDIIQINGVASSAAGYAESLTIGSSLTLTAINATDWVATSSIGTWNVA